MRLKSLAIRILHNLHLKHILEKNPQEVQKKSKKVQVHFPLDTWNR